MHTDIYWTYRDFKGDPLFDLALAFADLEDPDYHMDPSEDIRCKVWYDYDMAETPEDARLPISYWSKKRILAYVKDCTLISDVSKKILDRMTLDDLKAFSLKKVGRRPTGKLADMRFGEYGEWRNTDFYALDIDNINSLGGDL